MTKYDVGHLGVHLPGSPDMGNELLVLHGVCIPQQLANAHGDQLGVGGGSPDNA